MKLHMVDVWGESPTEARYRVSKDRRAFDSQKRRNKSFDKACKNTMFAGPRRELHRMTSLEAVKKFADESLDFIFIDAEHTYEGVKEDLNAWYSKIKQGGLISGHDFNRTLAGSSPTP